MTAPVPVVKVFDPETLVAPLRVTAPVPLLKVLEPEIVVAPFKVTAPVPVPNVPAPVILKLPPVMLKPLFKFKLGVVKAPVLGLKVNLVLVTF